MAPRQDRFTQQNRPRPMGDGNKGQSAQNRGRLHGEAAGAGQPSLPKGPLMGRNNGSTNKGHRRRSKTSIRRKGGAKSASHRKNNS